MADFHHDAFKPIDPDFGDELFDYSSLDSADRATFARINVEQIAELSPEEQNEYIDNADWMSLYVLDKTGIASIDPNMADSSYATFRTDDLDEILVELDENRDADEKEDANLEWRLIQSTDSFDLSAYQSPQEIQDSIATNLDL